MKINKYILLFLLLAFCFTDCKKYPEGPALSLCPKKWRITGSWGIESFLVNGADSIDSLPRDPLNPINPCYYVFGPQGEDNDNFISGNCVAGGLWDFDNNKKNITTKFDGLPKHSPFLTTALLSWEIQRLTKKQMWWKTNYNGKEYYIKFNIREKYFP